MKRSTAKILAVIAVVVVLMIGIPLAISGNKGALTILFLIYIPIAIYLNYCQRCKSCGRWPRKHDFWDEYCPRCGARYDD